MYALIFIFGALAFFCKALSVVITHLFYKDQFDWFKRHQSKTGKPANYFIFLFFFLSLFSPATLWHAHTLPDFPYRALKSLIVVVASFLAILYFTPLGD